MPTANFGLPLYTTSDTAALDVLLNGQSNAIDAALAANLYRLSGTDAVRLALTTPKLKEGLEFRTTDTDKEYVYDGSAWKLAWNPSLRETYTWSRANVDTTPQYPELVADATNTTDATISSFQRVSGSDPDGVAGLKIPTPGAYHVAVGLSLAASATGRSFIQIGADADLYWARASVFSGEDRLSVNTIVNTTAVDQVIPIWFYKSNGNLGANTGRVTVRRMG